MEPNNGVTEQDKFGFIAKVLKSEEVPEVLRREAAGLLVASGWAFLLTGTEDAVRQFLKGVASSSAVDEFYTSGGLDLLDDSRG